MIDTVLVAAMWVLLTVTITVLVADVSGVVKKKAALYEEVNNLQKEVNQLQYNLAAAVALRDEALHRYADNRQTLVAIATQNDNDAYFKVWAKKLAQDSINRTTHSAKN